MPEYWRPSNNLGGSPGTADAIPATIAGRHVFNQSKFDGNNAGANANDDAAIATDKTALLPGGTSTFANYTSFNRGLNGLMVDIDHLPPGPLTADDFTFKVGNTTTPADWSTLAAAPAISVRAGAGVGRSSRVSLIWPTGAAIKQWLQVTVKADGNTGLLAPDTFYFGNAVGESGNVAGDYSVSITDELLARNNPVSVNPGTTVINRFDYNRDGTVSVVDQLLARNNITTAATKLKQITVPLAGLSAQPLDDGAIPTMGAADFLVDRKFVDVVASDISKQTSPIGNQALSAVAVDQLFDNELTQSADRPLHRRNTKLTDGLAELIALPVKR